MGTRCTHIYGLLLVVVMQEPPAWFNLIRTSSSEDELANSSIDAEQPQRARLQRQQLQQAACDAPLFAHKEVVAKGMSTARLSGQWAARARFKASVVKMRK